MTKKNTKKSSKNIKTFLPDKRRALFGAITILIAAGAIYVFSGWAYQIFYVQPREARINEIYASIQGDEKTYRIDEEIFGDKRPYDYDKSRSMSSWKSFVVAETPEDTLAKYDVAIKDAGFVFIDEPYKGSVDKQYHYKSDNGEYVRLSVSSKVRDDAATNEMLLNGDFSEAFFAIDPNTAPSNVMLKVNLDDNNE